jgi:hypothetical protein
MIERMVEGSITYNYDFFDPLSMKLSLLMIICFAILSAVPFDTAVYSLFTQKNKPAEP